MIKLTFLLRIINFISIRYKEFNIYKKNRLNTKKYCNNFLNRTFRKHNCQIPRSSFLNCWLQIIVEFKVIHLKQNLNRNLFANQYFFSFPFFKLSQLENSLAVSLPWEWERKKMNYYFCLWFFISVFAQLGTFLYTNRSFFSFHKLMIMERDSRFYSDALKVKKVN